MLASYRPQMINSLLFCTFGFFEWSATQHEAVSILKVKIALYFFDYNRIWSSFQVMSGKYQIWLASFFRDLIITDIIINAKVHSVKFISDKVCIVAVIWCTKIWYGVRSGVHLKTLVRAFCWLGGVFSSQTVISKWFHYPIGAVKYSPFFPSFFWSLSVFMTSITWYCNLYPLKYCQ